MVVQQPKSLEGTALCWGCVPGAGLFELAEVAARHGFPEIAVTPVQYFRAKAVEPAW